eukprot:scaffold2657_cov368-Pavlova_lutheri.AAC.4
MQKKKCGPSGGLLITLAEQETNPTVAASDRMNAGVDHEGYSNLREHHIGSRRGYLRLLTRTIYDLLSPKGSMPTSNRL